MAVQGSRDTDSKGDTDRGSEIGGLSKLEDSARNSCNGDTLYNGDIASGPCMRDTGRVEDASEEGQGEGILPAGEDWSTVPDGGTLSERQGWGRHCSTGDIASMSGWGTHSVGGDTAKLEVIAKGSERVGTGETGGQCQGFMEPGTHCKMETLPAGHN